MPDTLFEKLEMPSAPARPFEDDGVVMTASATPLLPMRVWSECEDLVAAHLAQVCAWPEEARGQGWVPGDYSFYVLEFEPTPGVKLSVQFWSEPGDKLLMEACVTGAGPAAGAYATAAVREALAARGFEAGDESGHFQKRLDAPDPAGVLGLAREALAVLTECLGYDGRRTLGYLFCLGRRDADLDTTPARARATLRSVTLGDLESLLATAGHSLQPLKEPAHGFLASDGGVAYSAVLISPRADKPGHFGGIQFSAFAPAPESLSLAVVSRLALELPCARLGIDSDGDLALMQTVVVDGGVTREHLALQFGFWQQNLERVKQALMRHFGRAPGVVLH
jgi:hypothetical protein